MYESSKPYWLGRIHCICNANSGKSSSNLFEFHYRSLVSMSDTRRSRASSLIGPKGLIFWDREIHESCQIFVFKPFHIALPRFSLRRLWPRRMPRHPWEQADGEGASRKWILWQYLPVSTRTNKQSGTVIILHANLANMAWLKASISLNPSPSSAVDFVKFVHETQHSFLFSSFPSHQNRVRTDCILLNRLIGSWKQVIE